MGRARQASQEFMQQSRKGMMWLEWGRQWKPKGEVDGFEGGGRTGMTQCFSGCEGEREMS